MQVCLAYGKTGHLIELPDGLDVTFINPRSTPAVRDPDRAVHDALTHPINLPSLSKLVKPMYRIGIIFSDITRPTPNQLIIPAILDELSDHNPDRITLFNACGTHRSNTDAELRDMLGERLVNKYRIVQNDAFDQSTQVAVGKTSSGNEIWINRDLMECDIKILTGFIEPHFFAGFSGGGKAVMPGMAGISTILNNHNAKNIGHPNANWGVTVGNPIYEEILEAVKLVGQVFLLNVALNQAKQITATFTGDVEPAHGAGCEYVKKTSMVPVDSKFDIAITTNSGYPADINLYQSVKGISAAAQVIAEGGHIFIAAECKDGIPEHGQYGKILQAASSPQNILDRISSTVVVVPDQWQAQIQAIIQKKAHVSVYSGCLTDEQIRSALLTPIHHIETAFFEAVERVGRRARICVLPEGPQAIPYLT